jgi:hypothetical protein
MAIITVPQGVIVIRKVYDATPAENAIPDDKARATMRSGVAEILAVQCGR